MNEVAACEEELVPHFEIKVALLGHVSVGKTTVLNALFQDYYSEVSRRPTTAGVNLFRIISRADQQQDDVEAANGEAHNNNNNNNEMKWTATTTLQEITEDNKKLRTEKKVIQEKSFDILFDKPLIDMHENTSLVFVDIPGLNEADTNMMYLDYIRDHWDLFDCVIIVMDAEKGASTQEEVKLLEFAKKMLASSKSERVDAATSVFPIFIPMSAGNAFAYRAGANCSFEKFQQLDSKLIDTIGCDEMGVAKWKRQSKANKYKIAFQAMKDATQYQERLATTNFDTFLSALAYTLGGSETQRDLLHQQTQVALRHLSDGPIIANRLVSVYNTCQILNRDSGHLKAAFWNEFKERSQKAYEIVPTEINVSHFNPILDELIA